MLGHVQPRTGQEGPKEEKRYNSTLSLTSALDGVSGQRDVLAALPPGKTRYPLYRRPGGFQGRSGRVRKTSPPPGFDSRIVHPVASRYTDWAIPAPLSSRDWVESSTVHTNRREHFIFIWCKVYQSSVYISDLKATPFLRRKTIHNMTPVYLLRRNMEHVFRNRQ